MSSDTHPPHAALIDPVDWENNAQARERLRGALERAEAGTPTDPVSAALAGIFDALTARAAEGSTEHRRVVAALRRRSLASTARRA